MLFSQPIIIGLFFITNLALISYSIAIIPYDSIVIDQKKYNTKDFILPQLKKFSLFLVF
jgi:hypothetical protein